MIRMFTIAIIVVMMATNMVMTACDVKDRCTTTRKISHARRIGTHVAVRVIMMIVRKGVLVRVTGHAAIMSCAIKRKQARSAQWRRRQPLA